jgi:hypothetical protein
MKDLAKFATFLAVVALAIRIQLSADDASRKRRIRQFLIAVFALTLTAGLVRLDDWPFPAYTMPFYLGSPDTEISDVIVRMVDAKGREIVPDPFAWSPLSLTNLVVWLERSLPRLSPEDQRTTLAYLLRRAEERRGKRAIGPAKWLGVLAAPPDWGLYRRDMATPDSYRGLRVYRETWRPSHPTKRLQLLAAYDAR